MQTLQTTSQPTVPSDVEPIDLQIALAGDLSRLTPEAQLKFYGAVCQTVGLNPLTKPFDWLTFQGKKVLYANKGCAEQLRKIHGVTVEIVERKVEYGCLIVRVKATDKTGRVDESIGALPFNEKASGEPAAIAMMKCETKAKRRVTLSICGLGMLDESEVDSLREPSKIVEAMNGEESASSRAEKLNLALTSGEKEKAIDVATEPAKPIRVDVQSPFKPIETLPPVEPPNVPLATEGRTAEKSSVAPPAGLLNDEEVAKVMAAMDGLAQPKRGIEYLVYRGWLEKGKGIAHLKRSEFVNVTTKTPAFIRMVDGWKGTA